MDLLHAFSLLLAVCLPARLSLLWKNEAGQTSRSPGLDSLTGGLRCLEMTSKSCCKIRGARISVHRHSTKGAGNMAVAECFYSTEVEEQRVRERRNSTET